MEIEPTTPSAPIRGVLLPLILVFLIVVLVVPAQAQNRAAAEIDYEAIRLTKVVTAVRINEEIALDGRLDEPAWKLALPATDFIQRLPNTGALATEQTEARFLYDDDNLYVGVICFDSQPDVAFIKELKEDFDFNGTDRIQLIIDSFHDGRSGFTMVVHPAGGKRDSQIFNNGPTNNDWDGVWDAKVTRNSQGWIVEYVIPFKTLRFTNAPSQEWGVQFTRHVYRKNEESNWAPVPIRFSSTRASLAGTLRGLENIRQGRNLKIKPYIVGGVTQIRPTGPGAGPADELRTIRSLTRLKDYNGGFDAKYSLTPSLTLDTTYRTDFAQVEVDQQQVNLTRFNLFLPEKRDFFLENSGTFNFGPGGNLVPFFSRRIGLSSAGTPIPIIGGARVTGQVQKFDMGVLAIKTEREGATPSNNYFVGRLKRNLSGNSWIGTLVTSRNSTTAGDYNRVYGTDAHFQFYDRLEFDSYVLRSDTPGKSGNNLARRFQTGWRDDELTVTGEYNAVQTNFNPEAGFVRRGNHAQYFSEVAWKPRIESSDAIRNLSFGSSIEYFKGANGKIETRTQEGTVGVQFENSGTVNFGINQTFDRLVIPFAIRPNLSIPVGDYQYLSYTANFSTGQNHKIVANGNANWGDFWSGRSKSVGGGINFRPDYHFNIDLTYSRNRVELANGSFTTQLVGTRLLYSFSPRAFFNAFIQYNADTRQVSSNLRFDLIHHPLSDLYLVYNDRRDTTNGQLVERAFIVKLTNLFNF